MRLINAILRQKVDLGMFLIMFGLFVWYIINPEKNFTKVQDIEDLDEEKGKSIEEGKYYLSKEYWVVKATQTKSFKLQKGARLSALKDDFLIKKEIADFVDAEKDKMTKQ